MTFNYHRAYISLPAVTTHANAPPDPRVSGPIIHQIRGRSNFYIEDVNATIRAAMRPHVVE